MIVIQYKDNGGIVDIFDTAKEFKEYINDYLKEMRDGMAEDGLLEEKDTLNYLDKLSFETLLDNYLQVNDEVEIKIY